jgi:Ulp1 family protease
MIKTMKNLRVLTKYYLQLIQDNISIVSNIEETKTDNMLILNDGWKYYPSKCPKQTNSYDCGVFTCKYMEYLSRDKKLDFNQDDMNYFRIQIGAELLQGALFN